MMGNIIVEMMVEMMVTMTAKADRNRSRAQAKLIRETIERVITKMVEARMARSELAHRMKVAPSYITKILRGDENLTLETIAKVASALQCGVTIDLRSHT
jgi:transcriptional regulator with XRE-family HTH domain